jgi:APA family basic amino acid/polyamine antiporter
MRTEKERPAAGQGVGFVKGLGVLSATNIVIGSMIGSGIFLAPSIMAGFVGSSSTIVFLWIVGGLLTVFGALSLGELAAAYPHAGGQYVFLREAFSPLWGFLYGWGLFFIIQTGFIAAVSIAFAKYLGVFFPALGEGNVLLTLPLRSDWAFVHFSYNVVISSATLVSIACIAFLTGINILGVKTGALVQNIFTIAKMAAILVLVGAAFALARGDFKNFLPLLKPTVPQAAKLTLFAAAAVAMSKALFAYDAWYTVTFVAEEVKRPKRDIPLAMLLGTGAVTLLYTLATAAYFYIIPITQAAGIRENRIASEVAVRLMGSPGLTFITLAVLISTFGCINGLILSGARVYYAMAKDGLFFRSNNRLHRQFKTPHLALLFQGAWSVILTLTGTFSDLLTYTAFASLLFNSLTILGLFVLRYKKPELERPYKVWLYPILPLLYLAIALFFIVFIIIGDPLNSIKGLVLIGIGVFAYLYWRRKSGRQPARSESG